MTDSADDKPKIIIDEDWKSQVENERAQARQAQPTDADTPPSASGTEPAESGHAQEGPLPPASFDLLVTTLATQALAFLGQIPDPIEKKPVLHFELAQHHIDLLAMLQEKTKGNLTPEEDHVLERVLHELRMLFVSIQTQHNR
jgi:hypothetical protein